MLCSVDLQSKAEDFTQTYSGYRPALIPLVPGGTGWYQFRIALYCLIRFGGPMSATGDRNDGPIRDVLFADLARRQPLLVAINIFTALLFASGLANAAPTPVLVAWLAYMGISQAVRLIGWRHLTRKPQKTSRGFVATSAITGLGWGVTGILFAGLGSPTQQMLVPFFLAGMAAGSVVTLAAHLPAFYAFIVPALLPYAAHLALSYGQAARTMALTILAYGLGLSAVAYQVHQSLRRQVKLQVENGQLVADLGRARGRLQELLERRSAELDAVMETVPVAVWLAHDREAERITGNQLASKILRAEYVDNDSLGGAIQGPPPGARWLKDGEEVPTKDLPLQRAARGQAVYGEELRVAFDDGAACDILISAVPVRDGSGTTTGAVAAAMDITERKRIEAARERLNQELELRVHEEVAAREAAQTRAAQAERMQALGQLAGGIAHDFNNVLQAVSGGAAIIEGQPDRPETVRRFARLIADAALRGSSVTRRLLAFARRNDLRAAPVPACEVLGGLREILIHTLGSGITAQIDASPNLPPMMADRGQLETVLVNLAVNARDAMPGGVP